MTSTSAVVVGSQTDLRAARLERSRRRAEAKALEQAVTLELVKSILSNPIFELLAGFTLVELGQRYPKEKPLFTGTQGNAMQLAMTGLITAQQIAPLLPAIAAGGKDIVSAVAAFKGIK